MSVSVRYQNNAILSYSLIAFSPWEGLRVSITGTKGRIEMDIAENINHLQGTGTAKSSKGSFKSTSMRVYPMFGEGYEVEIPRAEGGHGGADPVMLEQIFSPNPPDDPFNRAASHIDGAASILVGISANLSMETGKLINVPDLFQLPQKSLQKV